MTDNLVKETNEAPKTDNPQTNQTVESSSSNDFDSVKERYKQQIEGSKKEVEKYRKMVLDSEVQKASQDANSLLELYDKDPKLANEVAKEF